jgi:cob(I)alamin adenosyltransferase
MKVYTKTGDRGTTALIGGRRVAKNHFRIEAYGSVDELMAYIGLLYDLMPAVSDKTFYHELQDRLMTVATILATDAGAQGLNLPNITDADVQKLELLIDQMELDLPPLTSFVLPGGHQTVSVCHIARTVCRRCERLAITVNDNEGGAQMAVKYLNRLSDFLFVLSRKLTKLLNVDEITWKPRK